MSLEPIKTREEFENASFKMSQERENLLNQAILGFQREYNLSENDLKNRIRRNHFRNAELDVELVDSIDSSLICRVSVVQKGFSFFIEAKSPFIDGGEDDGEDEEALPECEHEETEPEDCGSCCGTGEGSNPDVVCSNCRGSGMEKGLVCSDCGESIEDEF